MDNGNKIIHFNPSAVGDTRGSIFGLPFNFEDSEIVILPVPWDATVSFRPGCSLGPERVLQMSTQVDLYDADNPDGWQRGYYMMEISDEIRSLSNKNRVKAKELIRLQEMGIDLDERTDLLEILDQVNNSCEQMYKWVFSQANKLFERDKKVVLLGGDHSTSQGYYASLANMYDSFGILQIDAHCDLRAAYEGFKYSHASVMYNALQNSSLEKLVQLGIRDYSQEEVDFIETHQNRIKMTSWEAVSARKFKGESWDSICDDIINDLPENVCISLDIDGLEPSLCPNTGTPVPGGLSYDETVYLIRKIKASNKTLIGFDLVETGNGDTDGIVSSRLLYKLLNAM